MGRSRTPLSNRLPPALQGSSASPGGCRTPQQRRRVNCRRRVVPCKRAWRSCPGRPERKSDRPPRSGPPLLLPAQLKIRSCSTVAAPTACVLPCLSAAFYPERRPWMRHRTKDGSGSQSLFQPRSYDPSSTRLSCRPSGGAHDRGHGPSSSPDVAFGRCRGPLAGIGWGRRQRRGYRRWTCTQTTKGCLRRRGRPRTAETRAAVRTRVARVRTPLEPRE
ncbi:Hypothetical Protein RradSPS_2914 (plasmid) [Rubrobacter radiotolerans]|uniref:Uncharacterized protein n=1 Tax=Rubrobacter radiotolerans TaxID=42256 RepID=A0A023X6X4_RUBRA|nr:Hypothetical Protein RradSPS_2914 [Rubrobacter radiotolerans]SMC01849.1 conserved hypothetical protein [Rubrobacter radiotolerans DSM 5868]